MPNHNELSPVGEITERNKAMITLWWMEADSDTSEKTGQGEILMGEYATPKDAERAIPGALAELLGQCGSEQERDAIEAGTWITEL
jgi:hypothetical protein